MIQTISADDTNALTEFALFREQVYRTEGIRVAAMKAETVAFLRPQSPFVQGRRLFILLARDAGGVAARGVALFDQRYNHHWQETLGHIVMFEALPKACQASRSLLEEACSWLQEQGATAARAGFGPFEPGFVIDEYTRYLPRMMRHALPCYHSFLKDAGFATEKGASEYTISVHDGLVEQYQGRLRAAQDLGYEIVPLSKLAAERRVADFTASWNEAYGSHWGLAPMTEREFATLLIDAHVGSLLDLSAIAYRSDRPVGMLLVGEEMPPAGGKLWPVRTRRQQESSRSNSFSVGVSPSERGRGLSLALAAHAYLQLIAQGVRQLSYGLVLDDNWPSRRVAEKLGASPCANYITYRRALGPDRQSEGPAGAAIVGSVCDS